MMRGKPDAKNIIMTSSGRPSYPNPTLQEAICEIVFALPEGVAWNPLWFGEFFKLVQNDFSSFQPVSFGGVQIEFGNTSSPNFPMPSQIVRYSHPTRPVIIQLSDRSLAITSLPMYPGWDVVLQDIEYAFDKLKIVVDPARVVRIGMRYINRIERSAPDETLEAWFKSTDYIPKGVLHSMPGFVSLVQTRLDAVNRLNVIVGEQDTQSPTQPSFILDIDRSREGDLPLDTALLLQEATRLHDDIWEVFEAAKTEKLERLLNGELL